MKFIREVIWKLVYNRKYAGYTNNALNTGRSWNRVTVMAVFVGCFVSLRNSPSVNE